MKKIILCSILTAMASTTIFAEDTPAMNQTLPTPPPVNAAPTNATPATADAIAKPAEAAQAINCEYKIPAKTTVIEQPLLLTWSKNATVQSFTFDISTLDAQLNALKNCYTDQGWQGFNDALQKSGNLASIKTQQLSVSSQVDGEPTMVESKTNQWKISIPMQVVYQNTKEKITQQLTVDLTVGRKPSGDLGIMQMVAVQRKSETAVTAPAAEIKPAEPASTNTTQVEKQ